jgi:hypothetical protein
MVVPSALVPCTRGTTPWLVVLILCAAVGRTDTHLPPCDVVLPICDSAASRHGSTRPARLLHCALVVLRGGKGGMESMRAGMSASFIPPRPRSDGKRRLEAAAGPYVPGPLGVTAFPSLNTHVQAGRGGDGQLERGKACAPSPAEQFEKLTNPTTDAPGTGSALQKHARMTRNGRHAQAEVKSGAVSALDTIRSRLMQLPCEEDASASLGSQDEQSSDGSGHTGEWGSRGGQRARSGRDALGILTSEQAQALEAVKAGHNIFLTGSAGTGKSYVLRHLIAALKRRHGNKAVHVTASTGAAAVLIGGTTVHAFAGIGLGKDDAATLVKKVYSNKLTSARWQRARALIIDEISMIDCDLFDKLDYVARQLKTAGRPFGGLQLVVCGDFFQLPPVSSGGVVSGKRFAFESLAWKQAVRQTVELKQVVVHSLVHAHSRVSKAARNASKARCCLEVL